jgi:hypothetical protein
MKRKMIRTHESQDPIWIVLHHEAPHECPECHTKASLRYIGFVQTYNPGLHGKMYQCEECDTWIDCVWSKRMGTMLDRHPMDTADNAAV